MRTAVACGKPSQVTAASIAALLVLIFAMTWREASAADKAIAAAVGAPLPDGVVMMKPGVMGMAPIPNSARSAVHVEIVRKNGQMPSAVVHKIARKPGVRVAAKQSEGHCLATAIYFEARGESAKGQKAVAEVILARTRVKGRPKTICGVVYEGSHRKTGCQFSFTCDGASDVARAGAAWKQAKKIAAAAMRARGNAKIVRGTTFYHADYVSPGWASRMVKVAQIGTHVFYRPKPGHLF